MTERFFEAIERGDERTVDAELATDPGLLRATDSAGLSPVLVAAYHQHPALAASLAERAAGADPATLSIFDAAAVGDVRTVRTKLASGVEIDGTGPDGFTALHLASYFGHLDVARLLLERGADPNAVAANATRVRALHSAVSARHRDIASLLLALGASANVVQQGGFTPLHAAAQNGDEGIVDLLLLRDADPTVRADDGRTAIDLADAAGHAALADVLREASRG